MTQHCEDDSTKSMGHGEHASGYIVRSREKPSGVVRHLALADYLSTLVLDHERAVLAVNIQSNVVPSHRAAPPSLGLLIG
jgi:hypothetical protein